MEDKKVISAIGVTLFESDDFGGWKFPKGGVASTLRANKMCVGIVEITNITKEQYLKCINMEGKKI